MLKIVSPLVLRAHLYNGTFFWTCQIHKLWHRVFLIFKSLGLSQAVSQLFYPNYFWPSSCRMARSTFMLHCGPPIHLKSAGESPSDFFSQTPSLCTEAPPFISCSAIGWQFFVKANQQIKEAKYLQNMRLVTSHRNKIRIQPAGWPINSLWQSKDNLHVMYKRLPRHPSNQLVFH